MTTQVTIDTQSGSNAACLEAAADFLAKNPIYELIDWAATESRKALLTLKKKGSSI